MQNLEIKLLYARKSRFDEDWNSVLHSHPFSEIFYIVEGEGVMYLEDQVVSLKQNDLLLVSSGIRHSEDYIPGSPFEYYVLGIEGITIQRKAVLENAEQGNSKQDSTRPNVNRSSLFLKTFVYLHSLDPDEEWIQKTIATLVHESGNNFLYSNLYQDALLKVLLINIARFFYSELAIEDNKLSDKNKHATFVKNYLDVHYTRNVSLDELASLCYISKYHLGHEFQKAFKISQIEYQSQKRIAKAKELLTVTDHKMDEIANNLGFNSQSYFNQVFKKKTGLTPTQYRNKHK
jgi:AraC-like DNA-binding protein